MPVLVYVLGQNVHQATTASLVVVTAGAVIGGLAHARHGRVCWRQAIAFIAAALPGVIAGTALGQAAQRPRTDRGVRGHHARRRSRDVAQGQARRRLPSDRALTNRCPALQLARVLTAGLLVGAMTGFFGVGGGFLIVPTLTVALAFSMRMAVGTSLVIITAPSVIPSLPISRLAAR